MSLTSLAASYAETYVNAPARSRARTLPIQRLAAPLGGAAPAAGFPRMNLVVAPTTPAAPAQPAATTTSSDASKTSPADAADTSAMTALAKFIPGDILTFYLAGLAAIKGTIATTVTSADAATTAAENWDIGFLIACIVASAIWAYAGVLLASDVPPPARAWAFPTIAAPIAFFAYALAVPSAGIPSSALGALTVLGAPVVLHLASLVYAYVFPPVKKTS